MSNDDNDVPDHFDKIERARGDISYESLLQPEDRPRGVLSNTDREYLCGLREYSHDQSELNRRQAIRERTINSLRDFHLLWLLLDDTEWEKIVEAFDPDELNHTFSDMLAFMYLGINQDTGRMEEIIQKGVFLGANYDTTGRWSGKANEVDVSIDIEYTPNIDALYEQLQDGEGGELTPGEIGALVRAGKLDADDLEELEESGATFPGVSAGGAVSADENEENE
jgi:hypothetical protein